MSNNEVKSILISENIHEYMKKYSKKTGMKIRFIAEEAIKEFIRKRSVDNDKKWSEMDL